MADPRSEPSMEDILASIKRIIADDPPSPQPQAAPAAPQRAAPVPQAGPAASMRPGQPAPAPIPSWPRRSEPPSADSILELTDRAPEPFAPPLEPLPQPSAQPSPQPVQRAVDRLRRAEAEMPQPAPRPVPRDLMPRTPAPRPSGGDVTLDALVREMLQPLLSEWIDRNLPDMVERLVQAEIRRMTEKDG